MTYDDSDFIQDGCKSRRLPDELNSLSSAQFNDCQSKSPCMVIAATNEKFDSDNSSPYDFIVATPHACNVNWQVLTKDRISSSSCAWWCAGVVVWVEGGGGARPALGWVLPGMQGVNCQHTVAKT